MAFAGLSAKAESAFISISGFAQNISTKAGIIRAMRTAGIKTWQRQILLQDIGIIQNAQKKAQLLKFVTRRNVISDRLYNLTKADLFTNYQTVFRIKGTDLLTGEKFTTYRTVTHNNLQRRNRLEAFAKRHLLDPSPNLKLTQVIPVMGRKSPTQVV